MSRVHSSDLHLFTSDLVVRKTMLVIVKNEYYQYVEDYWRKSSLMVSLRVTLRGHPGVGCHRLL